VKASKYLILFALPLAPAAAQASYVIQVDVDNDNTVVTLDCDMYDEEDL